MKTTTSDLLFKMYDIMVTNDPGQPLLITACRHLRELGYECEEPVSAAGDRRFTTPGRIIDDE